MAIAGTAGSNIRNLQNLGEPEVVVRREKSSFIRGAANKSRASLLAVKRISGELIREQISKFKPSHGSDPRSRRGSGSSKDSGSSANNPASVSNPDRAGSKDSVGSLGSLGSSSSRDSASSEPRQPRQPHSPIGTPVAQAVPALAEAVTPALPMELPVNGNFGEPVARVTAPLATRLRCLRENRQPLAQVLVNKANEMADRGRNGDDIGVAKKVTKIVKLLSSAANALDFEVCDAPVSGAGATMMRFKSAYMTLCDEFVACYDDPEPLLQCLTLIIPDVQSEGGADAPFGDGPATPAQRSSMTCPDNKTADNLSKMDASWLQYGKVLKVRAMMRREKLLPKPREEALTLAIEREQAQADKAMRVVKTIAELPSPDKKLLVSTTGSAKSWLAQAKAAERQVSELKRELAIEQSTPPDARLLKAIAGLGPWKIHDLETYLGRTWVNPPAARPLAEPQASTQASPETSPIAARSARAGKGGMRARLARKSRRGRARVLASIVAAKRRAGVVRVALARFVARVRATLSRPAPAHQHAAGRESAALATGEIGRGSELARATVEVGVRAGSEAAARLRQTLADAQHADLLEAREIAVGARRVAADELVTLETLYRQANRRNDGSDTGQEIPGFPRAIDARLVRSARMAVARWGLFVRTSAWNQYAESLPQHELNGGQGQNEFYAPPSKSLREFFHVIHIAEILKALSEEQLAAVAFGLRCQGEGDYMPTAERETYQLMSHLVKAEDEAREATRPNSSPVWAAAA